MITLLNAAFLWLSVFAFCFIAAVLDGIIVLLVKDVKEHGDVFDAILWGNVIGVVVEKLCIVYVVYQVKTVIDWNNLIGTLIWIMLATTVITVLWFLYECLLVTRQYKDGVVK